jgi:hypothetical protein
VGVDSTAVQWVLPAATYRTPSTLALLNPGDRRADIEVVAQSASSQELVTGPDTVSLGPGQIKSFGLGDLADAGVVVRATNGVEFVATRRSDGESADAATAGGEADPARAWVVLPATGPSGGGQLLVLQNPSRSPASLVLSYIGPDGRVAQPASDPLVVPGGRVRTVDLSIVAEGAPVSVVVTATDGTIVAGCSSYSADGDGYASTLGVPIPSGLSGLH